MSARSEAKAAGAFKYSTGLTCKRGHTAERWTASGACTACVKDDQRKDSYRAKAAELAKRPDQVAWLKAWDAAYRKTPAQLAYHAYNQSMREAQKIKATPKWLTTAQRRQIRDFYSEAQRLTIETGVLHHVDHIIPLRSDVVCGLHVPWNLQVLTAEDNLRKNNSLEFVL